MDNRVCPPWIGYILLSPVRLLLENPKKMFGPFVRPGMTVLDLGCAMGFFSLPLAEMVGETGRVICVDVQQKMLDVLRKRARKKGLLDRIQTHLGRFDAIALPDHDGRIDLVTAIHMLHETDDQAGILREIADLLRPGGTVLIFEPPGHVDADEFAKTIALAEQAGLQRTDLAVKGRGLSAALIKPD
ncbi:MAG TPA: class I SAM-dependent methyltransferase [bacterium]|nr:class I SAM-dependent methyltransferase [bacterium]